MTHERMLPFIRQFKDTVKERLAILLICSMNKTAFANFLTWYVH